MKKLIPIFAMFAILSLLSCNSKEKHEYIEIETNFGTMEVMLYNSTPGHRDNILKLVKEGFYDDLLFHRVIEGFMIQGGDPDSRGAGPEVRLGGGGPGYTIPHEIGAPHLKGTLAAARTPNPEKNSSGSQFYIVHGKKLTDRELDNFETRHKIKYNEEQRRIYKEIGGAPSLDMGYTVYGEVTKGLEVVDKIAAMPKNRERPVEDVTMKIRSLGKR